MPQHKFFYRLSGMALTDAQKTRISEEIAVAVTRVIATEFPDSPQMNYQSPHPVCGGSHLIDRQAKERTQARAGESELLTEGATRETERASESHSESLPQCKLGAAT